MELTFFALRVLVLAYVGLCALVYFRQASYIYYPVRDVSLTPSNAGLEYEDLRLGTDDGETIAAWFIPSTAPAERRVVLFCHGNGGNIEHRLDSMVGLRNIGLNALFFDYRGYGLSTGTPSEEGTYRDAMAAWNWLVGQKGFKPEEIVVWGESLGGAVAVWLATNVRPAGLVLESTFTSAPDMGAEMFPFLPVKALCKFRYDSLSRIADVQCPVLSAHGRNDEMIPFKLGRRLYDAAPTGREFVELPGGHNDGGILAMLGGDEVLNRFLDSINGQGAMETP